MYTYNQNEAAEIAVVHWGEFNAHKKYGRQENQGGTASKLLNGYVWIDGRRKSWWSDNWSKIIYVYIRQDAVSENLGHPRPEVK